MDNHAELLARHVEADRVAEVAIARKLRDLGHLSGGFLYDAERAALNRLAADGRANHDLTSGRRYTLTDAGRKWLAGQES